MVKRIAIIYPEGKFDTVPCLVSMSIMLVNSMYKIDIFSTSENYLSFQMPGVETHYLPIQKRVKRLERWFLILSKWLPYLLSHIRKRNYDLVIGVDGLGIILATTVALPLHIPTVYYSLELVIWHEINIFHRQVLKWLEVYCSQKAKFCIIQDEKRAEILSKENNIKMEKMALLPNSYIGPPNKKKTDFLYKRLRIPKEKRIILEAGSIEKLTQSIPLAKCAKTWLNDWVLVLHTRRKLQKNINEEHNAYERELFKLIDNKKVYLSDDPVSSNEMNDLVSSADVGVALYEAHPNKKNIYHMGLSSGKISQYLKCGLPIITTKLPLIDELLIKYHCGVCLESLDQIGNAIEEVGMRYGEFRDGAIKCYEEVFRFEPKFEALLRKLRTLRD